MKIDRLLLHSLFLFVLILGTEELCAQSFTPSRVEGSVDVFKEGVWANYTSAKKIGALNAGDSLCVSAKAFLVIRDQENKDNIISDFGKGLFRGTVTEGVCLFKDSRRMDNRDYLLLSDKKESEVGEPANAYRGDWEKSAQQRYISSIISTIRESGKALRSKSISVIRKKENVSYYYCVKNTSSSTLYVALIEVNRAGSILEVDRDLLHLVIPPQTELNLCQYSLSVKREKNGYYAIGLPFILESAESLSGLNINTIPREPVKRDFNIVIAGCR